MRADLVAAVELVKRRYESYREAMADLRSAEQGVSSFCPHAIGAVVDYEKRIGGSMVAGKPSQIRRYQFIVEGIDPYFGDPFVRRDKPMEFEGWVIRGRQKRADGAKGRHSVRARVGLDGSVKVL